MGLGVTLTYKNDTYTNRYIIYISLRSYINTPCLYWIRHLYCPCYCPVLDIDNFFRQALCCQSDLQHRACLEKFSMSLRLLDLQHSAQFEALEVLTAMPMDSSSRKHPIHQRLGALRSQLTISSSACGKRRTSTSAVSGSWRSRRRESSSRCSGRWSTSRQRLQLDAEPRIAFPRRCCVFRNKHNHNIWKTFF